jgi:hypothetical protein
VERCCGDVAERFHGPDKFAVRVRGIFRLERKLYILP